jgi:hypothetical protein
MKKAGPVLMIVAVVVLLSPVLSACGPDITELRAIEQETIELLDSLEQIYEIEINRSSQKVEVYVPNIMTLGNALDEAGLKMPEHVTVIERIDPPEGLNPDPSVHFPQLIINPSVHMTAELLGKLELVDGYLMVDDCYIIWLPGYFVHNNDGTIEIWDREGNVVGRVGEDIYMGGGGITNPYVLPIKKGTLPGDTLPEDEKYWVQSGARLNLNFSSDLFNLEIVDCDRQEYYFMTQKPLLEEKGGPNKIITGTLVASRQDGFKCPYISVLSGSDNSHLIEYTPIWPSFFQSRATGGVLEILDSDGNVIARDGEEVTLDGITISGVRTELAKQLNEEMPGECYNTKFIVERVLPED